MPFSSGNSGAVLREAVVKTGAGCQFEAAFVQHLGEDVCPRVYSSWPEGYVMERLVPAARTPSILRHIETILEEYVWCRPFKNFDVEDNWIEFQKSLGIVAPEWVIPTEFCLIHGDPTVSNLMLRDHGARFILIDPKAPNGHMPSCKEVDMGKILQSYFGWESVAYGERGAYLPPRFMKDSEMARKATFWCGYHVARIQQLEITRGLNRPKILEWCEKVRGICHV